MSRQEVIKLLTTAGHSTAKSLEIALDYQRGDHHAVQWIDAIRQMCAKPT